MKARTGKIARLPHAIREQLNQRLLDNEPGSKILDWLNSLPEQKDQMPITKQNLCDWRQGGFEDWLDRQDKLEHTRDITRSLLEFAKTGGTNLDGGASSMLMLEIAEIVQFSGSLNSQDNPLSINERIEILSNLTRNFARVCHGDHERIRRSQNDLRLELDKRKADQRDQLRALQRQKLQLKAILHSQLRNPGFAPSSPVQPSPGINSCNGKSGAVLTQPAPDRGSVLSRPSAASAESRSRIPSQEVRSSP